MNLNLDAHELDPQVGNLEKESGASFVKADTLVETWAGPGKEKSPGATTENAAEEIQITTTSVSHSEETTIRSESCFNSTDKDATALNQPVIAVSEEYAIHTSTSSVTTGISSATAGSVFSMATPKSDTAALPETQEEDNKERAKEGEGEGEGGKEGEAEEGEAGGEEGEGGGGEEGEAEGGEEGEGGGEEGEAEGLVTPVSDVAQDQPKAEMELGGEGLGEGDDTTPPFDDMVVLPDGMISAASLDEIAPLYSGGVRNTLDQSKHIESEAEKEAAAEEEAEKAEAEDKDAEDKEEEDKEKGEEPLGAATDAPLAESILAEDSAVVQNDSDPQPQDLQGLMEETNNINNNNTSEAVQEPNDVISTEDKQVNTGAIANGISEGGQVKGDEAVKNDQIIESASIALPVDEPVIEGEASGLKFENSEEAPVQSLSNIASELGQEKSPKVKEGTTDMEAPSSLLDLEKPAIEGQTSGPVCHPEQAFAVQSLPEIASEVEQVGIEQTLTEEGSTIAPVDKSNESEQPEAEFEALIGRKVLKTFDGDDFAGEVIGYDAASKWYKVVYEDGDEEDLEKVELDVVLLPIGSLATSTSKSSMSGNGLEEAKERKPKKGKKTSSESTQKSPAGSKKRSKSTPTKKKGSQSSSSRGSKSSVKKVKSPGAKSSKKASSDRSIAKGKKRDDSTETPKKTNKRKRASIDEEMRTPKVHKGKKETSLAEQGKKSSSKKDARKASASKSVEHPTKGGGDLKRKGVSAGDEDMHRPSKRSKVDSGMEVSSDKEDASVIGSLIRKKFGGKYFTGEVVSYDKKRGYYKVQYEDGDKEDLEWVELEPILIDNQKKNSAPDAKASASGEKGKSLPVKSSKPKPKPKAKGKSKFAGKKGGSSRDKRKGRAHKPAG